MNNQKTVLIVEDHAIVTDGLKAIITSKNAQGCFKIVGETTTAEEAYKLVEQLRPNLVLADISLAGDDNGIRMTKLIVSKFPQTKVLMLSMHAKMDYVYEAIISGASGYLTKDNASKELLTAMKTVLQGEEYLDPVLAPHIVKTFKKISEGEEISGDHSYSLLTPKEQEVFRLLADGHKIAKIADTLKRSPKTIENHRSNIFSKLKFGSLIDLYKYAIRIGIIDPEFS